MRLILLFFSTLTVLVDAVEEVDTTTTTTNTTTTTTSSSSSNSSLETTSETTETAKYAPKMLSSSNGLGSVSGTATLMCVFVSNPSANVKWVRRDGSEVVDDGLKYVIQTSDGANDTVTSILNIEQLSNGDNGTYLCHAENALGSLVSIVENVVQDRPEVSIDLVTAVGASKIYLNWTAQPHNAPIEAFFLQYREASGDSWTYYMKSKIDPLTNNVLMTDLKSDSTYFVKLSARNNIGTGTESVHPSGITTLKTDPSFIPQVSVKGIAWNYMSISWTSPIEKEALDFIHYYKLSAESKDVEVNTYQSSSKPNSYLWQHLTPATNYSFTVSACNKYSRDCLPPSQVVWAETEDGIAGPPAHLILNCGYDNVSHMNFVEVQWTEPKRPNGKIEFFNIRLEGVSTYLDSKGELRVEAETPEVKTSSSSSLSTRFDFLKPNTNYSGHVCAVTRKGECGEEAFASCKMREAPPETTQFNKFRWFSDTKNGRDVFRLIVPKLSERNGRICCLRVVVVKLPNGLSSSQLPDPGKLKLQTYETVHASSGASGAYLAEILGNDYLGRDILVGDGQNFVLSRTKHGTVCPKCQIGDPFAKRISELSKAHFKRSTSPTLLNDNVKDGFLHPNHNYTAFVELIVPGDSESSIGRTPYLDTRRLGQIVSLETYRVNTLLISVLGILTGLLLVVLCFMLALLLVKRYSKKMASSQGGVELGLRSSIGQLYNAIRGRREHSQYLITPDSVKVTEMEPLTKDTIVEDYCKRHRDSDLGFQAEFEMLPDRFPDRTSEVCDRAENRSKNRYPDIKCYDQTRVKLSQIEDSEIEASDYINANFVMGYKQRKRWICAQGPLEHTVADFWRMIYEQGAELVIMLTCLEEYNRVKCAQYWPNAGVNNYSKSPMSLDVAFCSEKRYSDYIVRELRLTAGKKDEEDKKVRKIYHYHYLQWKDFNAPEHAPAMLKFVKRINEAWSGSSPLLVHCSAGVGRSGTLIAIDSLVQQLEERNEINIYKAVCDLRHQRNYLVQSVKQYMFVYRAIMEMAQFGDTELKVDEIRAKAQTLNAVEKNLKEEFERLAKVVDDRKPLSVGTSEENNVKNQSDLIIPFDRNRVILTPDASRQNSTYINASFIEGYHNDESYIITQDPMPSTIEDFWRMIIEHNIDTIVKLSNDEDWAYWDDNGSDLRFGSITVTMNKKELMNNNLYTRRELKISNQKSDEEMNVCHFAFSKWRLTSEGSNNNIELPSQTNAFLDLIEHTAARKANHKGPVAVHCRYGSGRSSIFVALSCLAQQMKTENRADVFTVVRKLRSQRHGMIQHQNQYKFIYSALADLVDLYRSRDEDNEYSVPVNCINGKTGANESDTLLH